MLNKDAILNADDLPRETVEVPEWGGQVCIRAITSAERDAYEESLYTATGVGENIKVKSNLVNAKAKLVAKCLIDADGSAVFDSVKEAERVLGDKSAKVLGRLYDVARKLSGISDEDAEELAKNFGTNQGEDSVSD